MNNKLEENGVVAIKVGREEARRKRKRNAKRSLDADFAVRLRRCETEERERFGGG
jgi:hypothetical protein